MIEIILSCAKEKKITPSIIDSEDFVTTRNGRVMVKVTCATCGFRKTLDVDSLRPP